MFLPESIWELPPLPDLSREAEVGLDTETRDDGLAGGRGPGWHANLGYVAGISVSWREHAVYINLRHPDSPAYTKDHVRPWLAALFRQDRTRFVFFNAGYDLGWLQADLGVPPPMNCADAGAACALVDENQRSYTLEDLCAWRGIPGKDEVLLREAAAAYGFQGGQVKPNLWKIPARFVAPYAEEDARRPRQLLASLTPDLDAQGMGAAFQLECDLIPLILEMRRRGLRLDVDRALQTADLFEGKRDEALVELARQFGGRWAMTDVRSNQRLEKTFAEAGVPFPRTAPTDAYADGQGSFQGDWMKSHEHALPRLVSAARKYDDLSNKFMRNYILRYAHRGRVHPTVNQFRTEGGGTRSHRVSYSDPPLQQMPSRDDETAPLVRHCFLPEPGEVWGALDYSQQEYRFMVNFAELLKLDRAGEAGDRYRNDPATDFHNLVVDLTGLPRRRAKDVNFAKGYGAGVPKFAEMTGMTLEEAERTMEQYDREMPFIKAANEEFQRLASRRGFIRLVDGARSHFDDFEPGYRDFKAETAWVRADRRRGMLDVMPCREAEARRRVADPDHPWHRRTLRRADLRKAFNRGVQGSSARQTKMAMRQLWQEGIMPRIQLHDELGFSLSRREDGDRAQQIMREVVKLTVPMLVDAEYGVSWGAAAKNKATGYGATWDEAWAEREKG